MSDFEQQQEQKEKQPSAFERLMVLYKDWNIEYVKTTDGRFAGSIDGDLYFIGERGGLWNWLTRQFFDTYGFAPPTSALAQVLNYSAAQAELSKTTVKVFTRIGHHNGVIYLDIANADRDVIAITPEGWDLVKHVPIHFERPATLKALPLPDPGTSFAELCAGFLNLDADGMAKVEAFLLAAFMPVGAVPHLIIEASAGSGKSVTSGLIKSIIDPNITTVRSMPKNQEDLLIAAKNNQVLAIDNLSSVGPEMSDLLCQLSTGAGFGARKKFTDMDEASLEARCGVILNGITNVVKREDLIQRCLFVKLPSLRGKYSSEQTLRAKFDEHHPAILGALLNGVVKALNAPKVEGTAFRMADFASWAGAAIPGFLDVYHRNRQIGYAIAIEQDPVAQAIVKYLEVNDTLSGTGTELKDELWTFANRNNLETVKWPATANLFGNALARSEPALAGQGISIQRKPTKNGRGGVTIISK